jgi:putative phosphoesterase
MLTLGVIADTHIPDRARELPQKAIATFEEAKVTAILHAGDISLPRVITQLEDIAPVHAVRGNRDIFGFKDLPRHRRLSFEEVSIGMTHGHGSWGKYFKEKAKYLLYGPTKFSYFEEIALHIFPDTHVVVLGHNHAPTNHWQEGQLVFNPGSATCPNEYFPNLPPSVGLLRINGENVGGEIVFI